MAIIRLTTDIKAPIERCFLLSLSVDLHRSSTAQTNEKAIAGVTTGLMNLNDTVTWEARHFGVRQCLTSKITAYEKPTHFVSEMQRGAFSKLHHQHIFKEKNGQTAMIDIFEIKAPFGIIGTMAEIIFLKSYMKKFLKIRNALIKQVAEGEEWKKYLDEKKN